MEEENKPKEVKKKKVAKAPKLVIADKMDNLVIEMSSILLKSRSEIGTAACANLNKAIADLNRISKNLKR